MENIEKKGVDITTNKKETPTKKSTPKKVVEKGATVFDTQIGQISDDIVMKKEANLSIDEKISEIFQKLNGYKLDGEILWGTVYAVESDENHNNICVLWNNTKIVIPEEEFFEKTKVFSKAYDSYTEETKAKVRKNTSTYYFCSIVPFKITSAKRVTMGDEKEYYIEALGSRNLAMETLRDIYFFHKNKKDKTTEGRSIHKDDIVIAHVINVRENSVLVEVAGIETRISASNLSTTKFVDNCNSYTKNGNEFKVKVLDLYLDNENSTVKIFVTGRLVDIPREIKQMKVNSSYIGKVDKYNPEKAIYTIILSNGILATVPESRVLGHLTLVRGDDVIVTVAKIYEEEGFVLGEVLKA